MAEKNYYFISESLGKLDTFGNITDKQVITSTTYFL